MKRVSEKSSGLPLYVGCSGWAYPSWKPGFYPAEVSTKKFLSYYASRLNTVEVNYTFRSLPSATTVESWLAQTGEDFRFSFKAPQRITHIRRLRDCSSALEEFAASIAPVQRARRMGLVLFQLPPNMKADPERLSAFLGEAQKLELRLAFEFRHPSWFEEPIFTLLRHSQAALCIAESDELETPDVATAPFACYRLRKSSYTPKQLSAIADRLRTQTERGDVFAYFKHEDEPTGPLRASAVLGPLRGTTA